MLLKAEAKFPPCAITIDPSSNAFFLDYIQHWIFKQCISEMVEFWTFSQNYVYLLKLILEVPILQCCSKCHITHGLWEYSSVCCWIKWQQSSVLSFTNWPLNIKLNWNFLMSHFRNFVHGTNFTDKSWVCDHHDTGWSQWAYLIYFTLYWLLHFH
jgi:hypothetical protein